MAPSARQAHAQASKGGSVIGWKLDRNERRALIERFPPRFANVVADHVTLAFAVAADSDLPDEQEGAIVGRADDGKGVEAMVVAIGGTTDRPDGSSYHITWSLGHGRKAKESIDLLRERTWEMFDAPTPIRLIPACFR